MPNEVTSPQVRVQTFTFWGEFEGGTFQGSHAEVEDGFEEPTGTMTLRP